jgi:hypothetical protein
MLYFKVFLKSSSNLMYCIHLGTFCDYNDSTIFLSESCNFPPFIVLISILLAAHETLHKKQQKYLHARFFRYHP